jgi:hypothetical protein
MIMNIYSLSHHIKKWKAVWEGKKHSYRNGVEIEAREIDGKFCTWKEIKHNSNGEVAGQLIPKCEYTTVDIIVINLGWCLNICEL